MSIAYSRLEAVEAVLQVTHFVDCFEQYSIGLCFSTVPRRGLSCVCESVVVLRVRMYRIVWCHVHSAPLHSAPFSVDRVMRGGRVVERQKSGLAFRIKY